MAKYRSVACTNKLSVGYNHVCEDCGHEWESGQEDQRCPSCGSRSTQSNRQR